ncbi:MFS transporter [Microlunatus flavus]|uniref:Predicted arabinose efflux permease, MFS family n=1 Tax=Microlunatus flavus TaxID=1036181 RepID=A0A1H9AFR2_9ACTN|nr:MFS transporter [Microlunatus flavus]SEP75566.1 Predicted arabinose efflux permease, MFS family [Microlunatus flavus]
MRTTSRRTSFWTAAAVAALALWTSAAPSVSYPLYAAAWHLTPATTTAIFAVYPVVLVVVLVVFGDLSDHVGRRASILLGLAAMLVGAVLLAVAPAVGWVFAGRAFMGLGVGLSLSPASAAMVDLSLPAQVSRAGSVTTAATATGLALATLVGGALVQHAPAPLHLPFVVLAVVVTAVLVLAWFLPRPTPSVGLGPWRPRGLVVPRGLRGVFAASATSVTAAYALGAVVLALGAQIARQLVGSADALVIGAILSVSAIAIGVVAVAARRLPARVLVPGGAAGSVVGLGLLTLSAATHSLALFLAASAVAGVGYSLNFLGGLTLVNTFAPRRHRAGMLSSVLVVAYLLQGATALLLGAAATVSGLQVALDLGSPAIGLVCVAALVLVLTLARPGRAVAADPTPVPTPVPTTAQEGPLA